MVGFPTELIVPSPVEWAGELTALETQGAPEARDTASGHRAEVLHLAEREVLILRTKDNRLGERVLADLFQGGGEAHKLLCVEPIIWQDIH